MNIKYTREASSSKKFNARKLSGLPSTVSLKFDTIYIRVYKSEVNRGYFSCTVAIPAYQDNEGYVLEYGFADHIRSPELDSPTEDSEPSFEADFDPGEPGYWEYEAPLNDHGLDTIPPAMTCNFNETIEEGRRLLLINLTIEGTPFYGFTLVDSDLYVRES